MNEPLQITVDIAWLNSNLDFFPSNKGKYKEYLARKMQNIWEFSLPF